MEWASGVEMDRERAGETGQGDTTFHIRTISHTVHFVVFFSHYGNVNDNLTKKLFALM